MIEERPKGGHVSDVIWALPNFDHGTECGLWTHGRGRTTEETGCTDLVKCKISPFEVVISMEYTPTKMVGFSLIERLIQFVKISKSQDLLIIFSV